jgi:hypothetical protein
MERCGTAVLHTLSILGITDASYRRQRGVPPSTPNSSALLCALCGGRAE